MRGIPAWDNCKKDEWSDFSTNFESYVQLSDEKELVLILLDFVNPNPQDGLSSNASVSTRDAEDEQKVLTPEVGFRVLSPAFKKLDLQSYHVMK